MVKEKMPTNASLYKVLKSRVEICDCGIMKSQRPYPVDADELSITYATKEYLTLKNENTYSIGG